MIDADQWNATSDIDGALPWKALAASLWTISSTFIARHIGTSSIPRIELNPRVARWRLSTLTHGEHGAMLVCSQLVENVVGQDAKLFQATQVVDEARHNDALHRYFALRLEGQSYPLAGNVREIFDTLLGTSAWYLKRSGAARRENFGCFALPHARGLVEGCRPLPEHLARPASVF